MGYIPPFWQTTVLCGFVCRRACAFGQARAPAVASTPARRFCATRPCTLCLYWAVCRQLFGLFRAKLAILSLHAGWRWRAAQSENQLDTGRFAMKGMHIPRVLDSGQEWLRSIKSSCDVIHDASNLLDVRPACVVELSSQRFLCQLPDTRLAVRG